MPNLYNILAHAQHGDAMAELGQQFELTPQQTEAAVAALLPAISVGLKQSTATPEGLGNLFALMAQRPDLFAMYDDPKAAFSREGRDAGNAALAAMFGSPEASRAVADQAQQLSGIGSSILKKLLPVIVGMILSGLMKSGSGRAAPRAPQPAPQPQGGGGLGDILREIFGQASGGGGSAGSGRSPIPPIGDILGPPRDGSAPAQRQAPAPKREPAPLPPASPAPTDTTGQPVPGGDVLSQILRELEKGIREGRIKPVIVGPYEIDVPGRSPSGDSPQAQQPPGGDILGQILRDVLGGMAGQGKKAGLSDNVGAAVFGERFEPGPDVDQSQVDSFQEVLDRFLGAPRR
jgi:hypothetical protein